MAPIPVPCRLCLVRGQIRGRERCKLFRELKGMKRTIRERCGIEGGYELNPERSKNAPIAADFSLWKENGRLFFEYLSRLQGYILWKK